MKPLWNKWEIYFLSVFGSSQLTVRENDTFCIVLADSSQIPNISATLADFHIWGSFECILFERLA